MSGVDTLHLPPPSSVGIEVALSPVAGKSSSSRVILSAAEEDSDRKNVCHDVLELFDRHHGRGSLPLPSLDTEHQITNTPKRVNNSNMNHSFSMISTLTDNGNYEEEEKVKSPPAPTLDDIQMDFGEHVDDDDDSDNDYYRNHVYKTYTLEKNQGKQLSDSKPPSMNDIQEMMSLSPSATSLQDFMHEQLTEQKEGEGPVGNPFGDHSITSNDSCTMATDIIVTSSSSSSSVSPSASNQQYLDLLDSYSNPKITASASTHTTTAAEENTTIKIENEEKNKEDGNPFTSMASTNAMLYSKKEETAKEDATIAVAAFEKNNEEDKENNNLASKQSKKSSKHRNPFFSDDEEEEEEDDNNNNVDNPATSHASNITNRHFSFTHQKNNNGRDHRRTHSSSLSISSSFPTNHTPSHCYGSSKFEPPPSPRHSPALTPRNILTRSVSTPNTNIYMREAEKAPQNPFLKQNQSQDATTTQNKASPLQPTPNQTEEKKESSPPSLPLPLQQPGTAAAKTVITSVAAVSMTPPRPMQAQQQYQQQILSSPHIEHVLGSNSSHLGDDSQQRAIPLPMPSSPPHEEVLVEEERQPSSTAWMTEPVLATTPSQSSVMPLPIPPPVHAPQPSNHPYQHSPGWADSPLDVATATARALNPEQPTPPPSVRRNHLDEVLHPADESTPIQGAQQQLQQQQQQEGQQKEEDTGATNATSVVAAATSPLSSPLRRQQNSRNRTKNQRLEMNPTTTTSPAMTNSTAAGVSSPTRKKSLFGSRNKNKNKNNDSMIDCGSIVSRTLLPSSVYEKSNNNNDPSNNRRTSPSRRRKSVSSVTSSSSSNNSNVWICTINTNQKALDKHDLVAANKALRAYTYTTEHEAREAVKANAPPRMVPWKSSPNCAICDCKFTLTKRACHCRNCGVCMCVPSSSSPTSSSGSTTGCSTSWSYKMVPTLYNSKNEKTVNVCKHCDFLAGSMRIALMGGDFDRVLALYETGNVNLRVPYMNVKGETLYPVHCAAMGGNLEVLKWLVDLRCCPIYTYEYRQNNLYNKKYNKKSSDNTGPTPILTSRGRSVLDIALKGPKVDLLRYLIAEKNMSVMNVDNVELALMALDAIVRGLPEELVREDDSVDEEDDDDVEDDENNTATATFSVSVARSNRAAVASSAASTNSRTEIPPDLVDAEAFILQQSYDERKESLVSASTTPDSLIPKDGSVDDSGHESAPRSSDECIICYENTIDCVIAPCGHQICCMECGTLLSHCPMCNTESTFIRVFRS